MAPPHPSSPTNSSGSSNSQSDDFPDGDETESLFIHELFLQTDDPEGATEEKGDGA